MGLMSEYALYCVTGRYGLVWVNVIRALICFDYDALGWKKHWEMTCVQTKQEFGFICRGSCAEHLMSAHVFTVY